MGFRGRVARNEVDKGKDWIIDYVMTGEKTQKERA